MRRLAALAALALVASGCGSPPFKAPPVLRGAPEPAVSPRPTAQPAGRLVAVGSQPEGIVSDATTGLIAVAVRGPIPGIDLVDGRTEQVKEFVPTGGAARHLALAGPGGPVLVPNETDDRLVEVALPGGKVVASITVGRQPHDVAAVASTILVTDELADTVHIIHIVEGGVSSSVQPAPVQPGGAAADPTGFVVIGVRARLATAYRQDGSVIGRAAAGAGPTHVAAGPDGYFYVADTTGDALLIYRLTSSSLRQVGRVPVGVAPYGIAADPAHGWVFLTLTGSDQLEGLHLSGPKVLAVQEWPTGRQPNSVAVDAAAGVLVVTDTGADQIEFIPLPAGA